MTIALTKERVEDEDEGVDPWFLEAHVCLFLIDSLSNGTWKGETTDPQKIEEAMEAFEEEEWVDWNSPDEIKDGGDALVYEPLKGEVITLEY